MTNQSSAPGPFSPESLVDGLLAVDFASGDDRSRVRVVRAPGRVNLIGEHTDYNEGYVLPVAINLEIRIALLPAHGRDVVLTLAEQGEQISFDLDHIGPRTGTWIDYVAGTAWALAEAGVPMNGFRGLLASNLPQAAGLASSAALELASACALTVDSPAAVDPMTRARICRRAENAYVGANVGLMDQASSSLGTAGSALLLDCRSLDWAWVPLPIDTHALVVCHTGSSRRLVTSEYNVRRAQCEAGVAAIAKLNPTIRSLRDVTPSMLPQLRAHVDDVIYRRCEHIVNENVRVLDTVEALAAGDLPRVGELFAASHVSLRDLYEVSSPELDAMVEIVAGSPGVVACRMTGAGFGGCTISLVERDAVNRLHDRVMREYPALTGLTPRVIPVETAPGAGRLV